MSSLSSSDDASFTPIMGDLPSIEAQGSKGFVVEGGAGLGTIRGSVDLQATSFAVKKHTDVQQSVIPGMDMVLNEKCLTHLRGLEARGTSLSGWIVIQEVARARVKEVTCNSKEAAAKVRAMWIARGEVSAMSECVQSSEVTGVIAYKARPVIDLIPMSQAVAIQPDPPATATAPPPPPPAVQLSVDRRLKEQSCTRRAEKRGMAARKAKLNAAVTTAQTGASQSWTDRTKSGELERCTQLSRSERTACIASVEQWLNWARALSVTLPAGEERVQTDCGERIVAYSEESAVVSVTEIESAEFLLGKLKNGPTPGLARQGIVLQDSVKIKEMVDWVLSRGAKQLEGCYTSALKLDPYVKGAWYVDFTIEKSGQPVAVSVEPLETPHSEIESCIERTVQRWQFTQVAEPVDVARRYRFGG